MGAINGEANGTAMSGESAYLREKAGPSLRKDAGARFTMTFFVGNL